MLTNDLSWGMHIDYTIKRVNKVIWQLIRFKQIGAPRDKLITFYILKIRSILMFGSVCFHSALTQEQRRMLEVQQKKCFIIILGTQYQSYQKALETLALQELEQLREQVCIKWAWNTSRNVQHKHLFPINNSNVNTRDRKYFVEYKCRTDKFYRSAIPDMIRKMNINDILVTHSKTVQ